MPNHAKPDKEKKNNQKFVSAPRINEPNTPGGHSDKVRQWDTESNNRGASHEQKS